jgi:hypothetical protein
VSLASKNLCFNCIQDLQATNAFLNRASYLLVSPSLAKINNYLNIFFPFVTYIFHVPEERELLQKTRIFPVNGIGSTPFSPQLANTGIIATSLASFCLISALIMLASRSGDEFFPTKA